MTLFVAIHSSLFRLTAHISLLFYVNFLIYTLSTQAHEVQRKEGFPEQALLQSFHQVNCNIKFPADAELVYVSSSDDGVSHARCEFHGNMLINDAQKGMWFPSIMWCKFKVEFSDGNGCSCEVRTSNEGWPIYYIEPHGCGCMHITRCEGDRCPGDGNTGQWPCGSTGCYYAPDVTLTVESSWK